MVELIHGDCLEKMKDIESGSVDLVLTDPPYGIKFSSFRRNRGNIKNDDNLFWVEDFTRECSRVLRKGNHLYCFTDIEYSPEFILGFRKNGFKIRNLLTIPRSVKGNGGDRIYQQQFEFCIFATLGSKEEGRKFNQTQILKPSDSYIKDKRYNAKEWLYRLPDNWHWTKASEHNLSNNLHPTQKNVECLKDMINISSNIGETILDPFMGSGSTGVACISTNRNFIGIELDETYFEIAKKRINCTKAETVDLVLLENKSYN